MVSKYASLQFDGGGPSFAAIQNISYLLISSTQSFSLVSTGSCPAKQPEIEKE